MCWSNDLTRVRRSCLQRAFVQRALSTRNVRARTHTHTHTHSVTPPPPHTHARTHTHVHSRVQVQHTLNHEAKSLQDRYMRCNQACEDELKDLMQTYVQSDGSPNMVRLFPSSTVKCRDALQLL
jgi:hypothetical protein